MNLTNPYKTRYFVKVSLHVVIRIPTMDHRHHLQGHYRMAIQRYGLTQTWVKTAPCPTDGRTQALYYDDRLRGFGLRVTAGGKRTYIAEALVQGRTRRVTVGPTSLLTCERARAIAMGILSAMKVDGRDVLEDRRVAKVRSTQQERASITVRQALDSRLGNNKRLKDSTKAIYRYQIEKYLGSWLDVPLQEITRDQVLAKHAEISTLTKSKADSALKALGTLYPYARKVLQIPVESPTSVLYDAKAWNGSRPRAAPVAESRLPRLAAALRDVASGDAVTDKQRTFAALLHFILLTGLRRNEAAKLTWARVDLGEGKITIDDTKNGDIHVLPLSQHLRTWLKLRKLASVSPYVFPSTGASRFGYLTGIAGLLTKLRGLAGQGFETLSPHDLRATFATVAERCQVNTYTLKKLLNHRPSDITGMVYVQPSEDDLRDAMERISTRLTRFMLEPSLDAAAA